MLGSVTKNGIINKWGVPSIRNSRVIFNLNFEDCFSFSLRKPLSFPVNASTF